MTVSKEEVKHIAYLARLSLKEQEIKRYQKELNEILDFVHQLSELNKIERSLKKEIAVTNNFRYDEQRKRDLTQREDLLHQKFLEKGYLKIPLIFKK